VVTGGVFSFGGEVVMSEDLYCPTCGGVWPEKCAGGVPEDLRDAPLLFEDPSLVKRWNELQGRWRRQCPAVEVKKEIARAHNWLVDHPERRRKNKVRYLDNWMQRAQEEAAKNPKPTPVTAVQSVDPVRVTLIREIQAYDGTCIQDGEILGIGIRRPDGILRWEKIPTHKLELLKYKAEAAACTSSA
jgi:hypothetical protein